jgi:transcription antitermination factor NusG
MSMRTGDRVEVVGGLFAGFAVEVQRVDGDIVRVRLSMFGCPTDVDVAPG